MSRNVCVRDAVDDAGMDAPIEDAGVDSADAGDEDAGVDAQMDAGPDSGPTDSATDAPSDVPTDALPPRASQCDELDVLFCEGFEDDLSAWTTDIPEGTETDIEFSDSAFRGRGVLRSYSDSRSDYSIIFRGGIWPDDTDDLWVRAYYFVDADFSTVIEPFEFVGDSYSVPHLVTPGSYADVHAHGVLGDGTWESSINPEADRWVCAEMHMHRDPTAGYVELFIDGAMAVRTEDMPITETFTGLGLGLVYTDFDEALIFFDEVAAHTSRIPCL